MLLKDLGQKAEAEEAYRQALAIDPQHTYAWSNLGGLLEDLGQKAEAEEAYLQALAVDPRLAKTWANLGVLLKDLGRKVEAEEAYRRALAVDPQDADAWSDLGNLLRSQKRYPEALDALEKAVTLSLENAIIHLALGAVYRKLGRAEEAEREFTQAKAFAENESRYNRACIAALCGELETAFSLLKEVLENKEQTIDFVLEDPDWEDLREHAAFKQILAEARESESSAQNRPENPG